MNFAQVRNVLGQKDGKNYQVKIEMKGIVGNTPPLQFSQQSGTKFQKVMITDTVGEIQTVKIYPGTGAGLNASHIGQMLSFLIGPNPSPQGNMYYNGFWQTPQTPPAPPQGQPAPQNRPQSTKSPQGQVDTAQTFMNRQSAWRGACDASIRSPDCTNNEILTLAHQGLYFINTGEIPVSANKSPNFEPGFKTQIDDLQGPIDEPEPQREPGEDE